MNAGKRWPAEWRTYADPISGAQVTQLTGFKGHSHHPYFTEHAWYGDGRKVVFISERYNKPDLYGVDLETGEITQHTDLDPADGAMGKYSANPARDQACITQDDKLYAVDLRAQELRLLYTRPEGYHRGTAAFTADGNYVLTYHVADVTEQLRAKIGDDVHRYNEYAAGRKSGDVGDIRHLIWAAHPHSMIVKIALDGSGHEVVHEENYFLGHINPSPTLPNIITFCHEGNWSDVENRIWGLNIDTGERWMIRPNAPDEAIGHEYWMADGVHVGYHGRTPSGPVYGSIRYDNAERIEAPFAFGSQHFHSRALDLIVGDGVSGDPHLLLWRYRDGAFQGPKVLAYHRASRQLGSLHVHPCISPQGDYVLYTADPQGYGQIFKVELPEFDSLPDRDDIG
jgi:oligogalacturonide lyase